MTFIPTDDCEREFDFVVVGSGAGGATVAGRMSENASYSVLLLEAGCKAPPLSSEVIIFFLIHRNAFE